MKARVRFIRDQRKNLRLNTWALIKFEGAYKLAALVTMATGFALMERFTLWATGYSYVTAENLRQFMAHPVVIAEMLLVLFLLSLGTLVDMAGVLHCVHLSYYGVKTDYYHAILYALEAMRKTLARARTALLLAVVLPMIPLLGLGMVPAVYGNLLFRDAIRKLSHDRGLTAVALLGVGVLVLVFSRWMYAPQVQLLEGCSTREAVRKSARLSRANPQKDLLAFVAAELTSYLSYALLLGVAMGVAFLCEWLVRPVSFINPLSTSLMLTVTTVTLAVFAAWSSVAGIICISILYYEHLEGAEDGPAACEVALPSLGLCLPERKKAALKWVARCMVVALMGVAAVYVFYFYRGRFNPRIEYLHQTEVTAHRGASRYFPENTMRAFTEAIAQEADWVELDIHMSRDGQLFVMHDDNLYRTCGVKGLCWDFTWEQLKELDAGLKFGKAFAGEKIPLLSDVIDLAIETGARLNIEIKPSRHEEGLEEKLVELLIEKDFLDRCVVTSQKYQAIRKVKELEPAITTVYVMGYAYGNIDRLSYADNFSINISSVTDRLVSRVHNAGKEIYVWTVNRRYQMEELMEKNVDNIITDDVKLARKIVAEKRVSNALHEYVRWLNRWFR